MAKSALDLAFAKCYNWEGWRNLYSADCRAELQLRYVKELSLKAYELVPEAYKQNFMNCKKENEQTYVEFARTKEQLSDEWCSSKKMALIMKNLRQLMLVEEFKRCINSDIKSF